MSASEFIAMSGTQSAQTTNMHMERLIQKIAHNKLLEARCTRLAEIVDRCRNEHSERAGLTAALTHAKEVEGRNRVLTLALAEKEACCRRLAGVVDRFRNAQLAGLTENTARVEEVEGRNRGLVCAVGALQDQLESATRNQKNSQLQMVALGKVNGQLKDALDVALRVQQSSAEAALEAEDIVPAPLAAAGGGVESSMGSGGGGVVQGRPRSGKGDVANKANQRRWTKEGMLLMRTKFQTQERVVIVIRCMHAELLGKAETVREDMASWYARRPKVFMDLLPSGALEEAIQTGQESFARAVSEHWSINTCLGMKYRNFLSRSRYDDLRNVLGSEFGRGQWSPKSFNGVAFPRLQTRYQLEKRVLEVKKETGMTPFDTGKGVMVDLRELVKVNVLESVKKGLFTIDEEKAIVVQFDGQKPELMNVLDSCNQHKGMKVTSAGIVFPHGTEHPQAPSHTHEHAHIEGDDGNRDMATTGMPILNGAIRTGAQARTHMSLAHVRTLRSHTSHWWVLCIKQLPTHNTLQRPIA